MEVEANQSSSSLSSSSSSRSPVVVELVRGVSDKGRVKVRKKTVEAMLKQFHRALDYIDDDDGSDGTGEIGDDSDVDDLERDVSSSPSADELCDLVKSRVECPDFLKRLENVQGSVSQNIAEEGNTWDIVGDNDLWQEGNICPDQDDYVLVRQEDIVDGIACFMAAYLLSLKETKDLNPTQLQEALCKTFSVKKKKGKLMKAWNGSKVIYNVASWGATAIGIYQNPAIISAASTAFWTSCRVISKLL